MNYQKRPEQKRWNKVFTFLVIAMAIMYVLEKIFGVEFSF